jgi:hypothetical protein
MHIRMRYAAFLALAAVAAVALAGIALAAPDGNTSSVKGSGFKPAKLPKNTYKSGALITHTHTNYAHPGNELQGGFTDRAQLYFDNDGKLNPTGVPRCAKAKISGNLTMKQAMAKCGKAKVGTGRAQALAGTSAVNGCVLVFNGSPTPQGQPTDLILTRLQASVPSSINCANPATNTNGNVTVLLEGVVKRNPASLGPDFKRGNMLDVNHIPRTLPLTDFRVTTKRGKYISSRCHDSNKRLNIKGKFTYSDGQSDTVASAKACKVG